MSHYERSKVLMTLNWKCAGPIYQQFSRANMHVSTGFFSVVHTELVGVVLWFLEPLIPSTGPLTEDKGSLANCSI